jgi:hypothetical protein
MRTETITQLFVILTAFFLASCSQKVSLEGSVSLKGVTAGTGPNNSGGQAVLPPPTVSNLKIQNQRQAVESLMGALPIPANSRPTLMAEWERVKGQLSVNGTANEFSSAALSASTRLVSQACTLVPITSTGLPPAPQAGNQPSPMDVQKIANYFSQRFLNRDLTTGEMGQLSTLVTSAYSSTSTDAQKYRILTDMICTVVGISPEAQIL